MYKITIDCTNQCDFSFDGKKITKNSYEQILKQLNPTQFDFVDSIHILHKEVVRENQYTTIPYFTLYPYYETFTYYTRFTYKSFEVVCNKINEEQFVDFVYLMNICDFTSENNCSIYLRDNCGNFVYTYNFNEILKRDNPIQKPRTNLYIYDSEVLYKK
jgi:hypothetical protein